MRPIRTAAMAAATVLLLTATAGAEPVEPGGDPGAAPLTKAQLARIAIDACHKAIERELLGRDPKDQAIDYEGDSVYHATIEVIVNGALELAKVGYDYTCRYNTRSEQIYGVKIDKRKR